MIWVEVVAVCQSLRRVRSKNILVLPQRSGDDSDLNGSCAVLCGWLWWFVWVLIIIECVCVCVCQKLHKPAKNCPLLTLGGAVDVLFNFRPLNNRTQIVGQIFTIAKSYTEIIRPDGDLLAVERTHIAHTRRVFIAYRDGPPGLNRVAAF